MNSLNDFKKKLGFAKQGPAKMAIRKEEQIAIRKEEQSIIDTLSNKTGSYVHIESESWAPLLELPLGQWSQSFCENSDVAQYITHHFECGEANLFRWLVEKHLVSTTPIEELNQLLEACNYTYYIERQKAKGQYMRKVDDVLIESIYELKNEALIGWIKSYFPPPPQYYTTEKPEEILSCSKEKMESELLEAIMSNDRRELAYAHLDRETYLRLYEPSGRERAHKDPDIITLNLPKWAKESMDNANAPYQPKCDKALAKRIMDMSKNIAVLDTAKYPAKYPVDAQDLTTVLDDALYSQSALADLYMPHKTWVPRPNAITLGLQKARSEVYENITLEFDLEKLLQNQPIAYYTQKDFSLSHRNDKGWQTIRLGQEEISFCFLSIGLNHDELRACALAFQTSDDTRLCFDASMSSLTSDNLQDMEAILTLNFFRFIDNPVRAGSTSSMYAKSFYEKLAKLSDAELQIFLTNIQANFAEKAQLHLYRTHKIDFDTLNNIRHERKYYSVSVSQLIEELNTGCVDTLHVAHVMIPELLQSKRFREHLLSRVTHKDARSYLKDMSKLTSTPESNALVQKQLRQCISLKIHDVESKESPAESYIRLLSPDAWSNFKYLSLPDDILTSVLEEASRLAREKLLRYVESAVHACDGDSLFSYAERKNMQIRHYIPFASSWWSSSEDKNEKARETFQTLFEECEARILKEKKSKERTPSVPQEKKPTAPQSQRGLFQPSSSNRTRGEPTEESQQKTSAHYSSTSMNGVQKTTRKTEKEALSESGFDNTLEQMKRTFKTEHEPIYHDEGKRLHRALSDTREEFLRTGNSDNFVRSVKENITKSEPVLNKSPVWKQFLLDILNAVIFIFTLGISYMVTGRVRLFTAQPRKEYEKDEVKAMNNLQ